MTKKSFIEATKGKGNCIVKFEKFLISITLWKNNPWELVVDDDFNKTCERSYEPLASFHTREELWRYLKQITK